MLTFYVESNLGRRVSGPHTSWHEAHAAAAAHYHLSSTDSDALDEHGTIWQGNTIVRIVEVSHYPCPECGATRPAERDSHCPRCVGIP